MDSLDDEISGTTRIMREGGRVSAQILLRISRGRLEKSVKVAKDVIVKEEL